MPSLRKRNSLMSKSSNKLLMVIANPKGHKAGIKKIGPGIPSRSLRSARCSSLALTGNWCSPWNHSRASLFASPRALRHEASFCLLLVRNAAHLVCLDWFLLIDQSVRSLARNRTWILGTGNPCTIHCTTRLKCLMRIEQYKTTQYIALLSGCIASNATRRSCRIH